MTLKSIPGPGAYEIKTPLSEKPNKKGVTFGGEGHKGYLNQNQLENPGPGSYYPEHAESTKSHSSKTRPFGSTTKRFDHEKLKFNSMKVPAPGSYDVDQINSLVYGVQKRIETSSMNPAIAFGSFTERFRHKQAVYILFLNIKVLDPGPGQYDLQYEVKNGKATAPSKSQVNTRSQERLKKLLEQGPTHFKVGKLKYKLKLFR
jgi:hypothetical protein